MGVVPGQCPFPSDSSRSRGDGAGGLAQALTPSRPQLTASEEEFLRTYAGVVSTQMSQLPPHAIDQGELLCGGGTWGTEGNR